MDIQSDGRIGSHNRDQEERSTDTCSGTNSRALESQKNDRLKAGMNDFLTKPVFRDEVAQILMRFLKYKMDLFPISVDSMSEALHGRKTLAKHARED